MTAPTSRAVSHLLLGLGLGLAAACTGERGPQGAAPPVDGATSGEGGAPSGGTDPWASAADPPPAAACRAARSGSAFHRLSRTEYQNTVNDLLGTRLPLREQLSVDALVFGFDNNGDTAVSAPLVQRYLNIAEQAVAAALADPQSRQKLIPCALDSDASCRRQVIQLFLPRAFRRPVQTGEVDQFLRYTDLCSEGPLAGIACALEAALVDPSFLFRTELAGDGPLPGAQTCLPEAPLTGGNGITAHALAARLSYLLWSSAPDQRLLDLAASGQLQDPAVIEAEVNRMLAPAEQARFTRPFSESLPVQWLGLDSLEAAAPSPTLYPGFDEELRRAMAAESRLFFAELLRANRSAMELLRAPFTFVNERLARHYGLSGVRGPEMRKVDTGGSVRGGILTQASLLTLTSSSENTSISVRARWVLQNLLCTPLGDPPPGAEETVPAPDPSLGLTRRQSLERRTAQPPCSSCHAVLNPFGFALEIFDAIGAERSEDAGQPIDPSGVLPDGAAFASTDQLLALLQKDPRFPACLTEKMLVYALGRGLSSECDRQALKILTEEFARDGYRLKNQVVRIARSELFRSAHRPRPEALP